MPLRNAATILPATWYGSIPDLPDQRDQVYPKLHAVPKKLPHKVDLRAKCSPIEDHGQVGSCTANALTGTLAFLERKQNPSWVRSPWRRRPICRCRMDGGTACCTNWTAARQPRRTPAPSDR